MVRTATKKTVTRKGINSVEDLDSAFKAWGELQAKEAALTAELNGEITALKAQYQGRMVGPNGLTFEAGKTDLENQIRQYCTDHKDELLTNGTKTRQLTHGEIKWLKKPISLDDTNAKAEASAAFVSLNAILTFAREALKKFAFTLFANLKAPDVVKVSIEWDKAAIKKKYEAREITGDQLEAAGFAIDGGYDVLYVKPAQALVKTE